METNSELVELLKKLHNRLGELSERVDLLDLRLEKLADNYELNEYPNKFLPPKQANEYLCFRSVQGLYSACRSGRFVPGDELIDISPEGSDRPTYLINPRAYFKRMREDQKTLK